jgi:hypothetical protein
VATPNKQLRENLPSVVARKAQLFERDAPSGPAVVRKPFADYLRDTPAAPIPLGIKAALWAAGVLVGLILLAALLRSPHTKLIKPAANAGGTPAYLDRSDGFLGRSCTIATRPCFVTNLSLPFVARPPGWNA